MLVGLGAIVLVVGASLAWSGLDMIRKILASRIRPIPLVILLTAGQVPIFGAWFFLAGRSEISWSGYLLPGLAAVVINIAANLMFVTALKLSPFSLTIPFLSLTPVYVTIMATLLLGEHATPAQFLGILIAVFGALSLNLAAGEGLNLRAMWRAFLHERGSVLMTGVAILWSINSSLDKIAVGNSSVAFHAMVQVTGIATGLLVVSALRGQTRELVEARPHVRLIVAAVAVCACGLALELTAIQITPLRLVAVVKRMVELTMAVVIGRFVFKEAVTWRKVAALVAMAVGILIILFAN